MTKFNGRIVQLGFGAVGKSFYDILPYEVKFDKSKYLIITQYGEEFDAYKQAGGTLPATIEMELTKDNIEEILSKHLTSGDLLADFADIGKVEVCDFCAKNNIMYLNTGNSVWPNNPINIFEQNQEIYDLAEKYRNSTTQSRHPILVQHGNNPGLVSHFVKEAISYIADTQHKKNKTLHTHIRQGKFNKAAQLLGVKTVHINDVDLQEIETTDPKSKLWNTWSPESFFWELVSNVAFNIGTHEKFDNESDFKHLNPSRGYVELNKLAAETKCRTYYPDGAFDGFVVPHEETITIANHLQVMESDTIVYRPTVMFVYKPCLKAIEYLAWSKNTEATSDTDTVMNGYLYPEDSAIAYEEIVDGTEYVGVLIVGDKFDPVWVGNRIEWAYIYKHYFNNNRSDWQTPTITPVAASAVAGICWMIKNKDKGGIYFPDDIDHEFVLKIAEKYISKTIYKTIELSS